MSLSPTGQMEAKAGIQPLEELLAERDVIVKKLAPLRAKYGPGGTYADLRRIKLAKVAAIIRAEAARDKVKLTQAQIEDMAHADPRYVDFVVTATQERERWIRGENAMQDIQDTIMRGQAIARMYAAEAHL